MKPIQPSQGKGSFSRYVVNKQNYTAQIFLSRMSKLRQSIGEQNGSKSPRFEEQSKLNNSTLAVKQSKSRNSLTGPSLLTTSASSSRRLSKATTPNPRASINPISARSTRPSTPKTGYFKNSSPLSIKGFNVVRESRDNLRIATPPKSPMREPEESKELVEKTLEPKSVERYNELKKNKEKLLTDIEQLRDMENKMRELVSNMKLNTEMLVKKNQTLTKQWENQERSLNLMREKQKLIDQEKPQLRLEVKRLLESKHRKEEEKNYMQELLRATREELDRMRQRATENRISYNTNKNEFMRKKSLNSSISNQLSAANLRFSKSQTKLSNIKASASHSINLTFDTLTSQSSNLNKSKSHNSLSRSFL